MDVKKRLFDSLNLLPSPLSDFADTLLPVVSAIDVPTDEASAILADGCLAAAMLSWMSAFSGFPVLQMLLRLGQSDATQQAAFFSRLQMKPIGGLHRIEILEPSPVVPFSTEVECPFRVRIVEGGADYESATLSVGSTTISFTKEEDVLTGGLALPIGLYVFDVSVTFAPEYVVTASVDFEVQGV